MGVRPDNRLADAPMTTVSCATCGAGVEVRKSSWEQTSVQWSADAMGRCIERRATDPATGSNKDAFVGCEALRQSIREASVRGDLPVQDGDPLPTHPENEVTHA